MSEAYDGASQDVSDDTSAADQVADQTLDQGDDQSGDDAAASTDEPGDKPKKSVQDRIDEITRDKHAERKRAEAAERELERLKAERQPKAETPPEDTDPEPDPEQYRYGETDPAYTKDLGKWSARQEFARLSQESERKNQARTVDQTWEERQATFAKDKPDFNDKVYRGPEWACSPVMADAIKTSEVGAAVAYHLATNPDEARRIAGLNNLAQVREIGRLEARLETPAAAPVKTASDAPTPPPQVRGQGGRFKVAADTDDFAAFDKAY